MILQARDWEQPSAPCACVFLTLARRHMHARIVLGREAASGAEASRSESQRTEAHAGVLGAQIVPVAVLSYVLDGSGDVIERAASSPEGGLLSYARARASPRTASPSP